MHLNEIYLKRIYDPYDNQDGTRILVDRLWPRGIKKSEAHLNQWAKDVAPSSELRKWFNHQPERFSKFREEYVQELRQDEKKSLIVGKIAQLSKENTVTILYGAKDTIHNHAVILREEILKRKIIAEPIDTKK